MSPEKQAAARELRRRIVNFTLAHSAIRGYPPTYDEITEGVGAKSKSAIRRQMNQLEKEGYISRVPMAPRTIRVLKAMA